MWITDLQLLEIVFFFLFFMLIVKIFAILFENNSVLRTSLQIFLTLLVGALRATPAQQASLFYKAQFCLSLSLSLCVCVCVCVCMCVSECVCVCVCVCV